MAHLVPRVFATSDTRRLATRRVAHTRWPEPRLRDPRVAARDGCHRRPLCVHVTWSRPSQVSRSKIDPACTRAHASTTALGRQAAILGVELREGLLQRAASPPGASTGAGSREPAEARGLIGPRLGGYAFVLSLCIENAQATAHHNTNPHGFVERQCEHEACTDQTICDHGQDALQHSCALFRWDPAERPASLRAGAERCSHRRRWYRSQPSPTARVPCVIRLSHEISDGWPIAAVGGECLCVSSANGGALCASPGKSRASRATRLATNQLRVRAPTCIRPGPKTPSPPTREIAGVRGYSGSHALLASSSRVGRLSSSASNAPVVRLRALVFLDPAGPLGERTLAHPRPSAPLFLCLTRSWR